MGKKVESKTTDSTWGGNFQVLNQTGNQVTNCYVEHFCEGPTYFNTLSAGTLANGSVSGMVGFTTASGLTDYWVVSFIDQNGNLIIGEMSDNFTSGYAGSTVTITLQPGGTGSKCGFKVTMGDSTDYEEYYQWDV